MKRIKEVGENFYNIRAPFKIFGLIDVGTHMSIIKTKNGKFICIDAVEVTGDLKGELDALTDNGKLIESVIATHPFHTLSFKQFYQLYPSPKYFGTPRHLKILSEDVKWEGELLTEKSLKQFEPDLQLQIPEGTEYVDPKPSKINHLCGIFVFHPLSKTIHNNDTLMVSEKPNFLYSLYAKDGEVKFHSSISGPGLHPTKEAPLQFKKFIERVIKDWDFDNICSAHNGNLIGGAKKALSETLKSYTPFLENLSKKNSGEKL